MSKKLFIVISLMAIMLSACGGGQPPAETATPAPSETSVPTTSVTVTSVATLAATETSATSTTLPTNTSPPATPRPTNPPDCTNRATFVADVTIPDNSEIGAGTLFTKTWRIGNLGTCTWGPDYTLTHYSDERMGALSSIPLGITPPGGFLEISVDLRAPNSIGTHRSNFVIKNPAGLIMSMDDDSRLWVIIDVTNAVTATATATTTEVAGTASGSVTATSTGSSDTSSGLGAATAVAACSYTTDSTKLTETIAAVNAYRARNNLPAYTLNTLLAKAAQRHANDMACNKRFVHTGSDGSTPQSRVAASGYIASSMSENVYASYPPLTGQGVVNWWINDKTDLRHNQNLLSTTFTEIGVGYSFYENFGYYVLVVGKP